MAVELDDKALLGPHGVDEEAFDEDVRGGQWQAGLADEREKAAFELGAGIARRRPGFSQQRIDEGESVPSVAASPELVECAHVEQAQPLGLLEGTLELVRAHDLGEVEEGASHRGDRDPASRGAVVRVPISHAMEVDPWALMRAAPRHRHVDSRASAVPQFPESGPAPVAEQGVGTVRQHGGHPVPVGGQGFMPDGIDACVHQVQAAHAALMLDGAGADPKREKLPLRDDSVLPAGQRGHRNPT